MACPKHFLPTLLIVSAFLLTEVSSTPDSPAQLSFASESKEIHNTAEDCNDATDCTPYGHDICMESPQWANACCRSLCEACDDPIPSHQQCEPTTNDLLVKEAYWCCGNVSQSKRTKTKILRDLSNID